MLRISPDSAGIKALCLWALIPGAILSPFVFWQGFGWGIFFVAFWLCLSFLGVPLHLNSLAADVTAGEIRLRSGVLFKRFQRLPTRCVTGFNLIETPLLKMSNCCVLLIYTSGTLLVLPALHKPEAQRLLVSLQEVLP